MDTGLGPTPGGELAEIEDGLRSPESKTDDDEGAAELFGPHVEEEDHEEHPATSSSDLVQRICSVDVCEVFSLPRVVREAKRYGLSSGEAIDFTT